MQEIPGHGPLYAYQPLDTSREEIRLVRFADSANQSSDIRTLKRSLHLHIESFSLASVPAYTALSLQSTCQLVSDACWVAAALVVGAVRPGLCACWAGVVGCR